MTWRRTLSAALATACGLAVIGGCTTKGSAPPQANRPPAAVEPPFGGAAALPPADMADNGPGSLLDVKPLDHIVDFDQVNAVGVRVVYRSTDSKGAPTTVSGIVVVPPGKPPKDGWPIISFGHDVTGVQKECTPSLAAKLGGYSGVISVLVDRGYIVAMTDYQGLGVDWPPHPMLDAITLGNNMIDAARAARRVLPAASNRWTAFGIGQGGAAAWAADAQAATYGNELDLVGAVAVSPLADITGLADAMANETLAPAQYRLAMLALTSLALTPDTDLRLEADNFLTDKAKSLWGDLTNCATVDPLKTVAAAAGLAPADLKPKTPAAADHLRRDLQQLALPGPTRLSAPMLVIYATLDPVILPGWIEHALRTACGHGDPIEVKRIGDLSTLNEITLYDAVSWVQGRFAGQRATDICVGV